MAMVGYFSTSLLFSAFAGYGGCEVVAIPSLIFRRWYTVYCPLNAIDVVERSLTASVTASGRSSADGR